jgi:hypothetical protein
LPSYQHFRASISRHDHQRPCVSDGFAPLHSTACAVGTPIGRRTAMQAAEATRLKCFVIEHSCGKVYLWKAASLSNLVANGQKFGHIWDVGGARYSNRPRPRLRMRVRRPLLEQELAFDTEEII